MLKRHLSVFIALLVLGCSANKPEQLANNEESELICLKNNINNADKCLKEETQKSVGLKCQYVEVSGTRFKQKQCTTLAQREAKQEDAFKQMRQMQGDGTVSAIEEGIQ